MAIGQKCSSLKNFFKIRLLLLIVSTSLVLNIQAESKSHEKITFRRSFQTPSLSLQLCHTISNTNVEGDKLASDNVSLFLTLNDGKIRSVNPFTNQSNWETEVGGKIISKPFSDGDDLYVVSKILSESDGSKTATNFIRKLDKKSGVTIWQTKVSGTAQPPVNTIDGDNSQAILSMRGRNLVVALTNGNLYLIDSIDGKISVTRFLESSFVAVSFLSNGQLLFGTSDGQIVNLSDKDLSDVFRRKLSSIPTAVLVIDKRIFWGNEKGELSELQIGPDSFAERRKFRTGGAILNIIETMPNSILVSSADNYIYSVLTENGKLLWKKRLSSRPAFSPLINANYAVITTIGEPEALIIEIQTGKTLSKVKLEGNNFFTGSPLNISPFIIFPNAEGLSFFSAEQNCETSFTNKK